QARVAAGRECYEYLGAALDERQRHPRDDALSAFLHMEVEGERLTRDEVLDICFLFVLAGLDTVTDALDCFFVTLSRHPDIRHRLSDDPASVPGAVEELLRFETPVAMVARVATAEAELSGCPVRTGDFVSVLVGSANTDPDRFDNAHELDIDRYPNRHYAFGGGIHHCIGAHLARLE